MRTSKLRYIFTWLALVLLLGCGTLLMILSWNSKLTGPLSPTWPILLWSLISLTGIYLFLLAVKKAHRQWVNEKRELEQAEKALINKNTLKADSVKEKKDLDFAATARKIVRRIPENIARDQLGSFLLKQVARELEIMSGVFYSQKKGVYKAVATYAMASSTEPYTFKSGEGLSGQVAKNQQVMVLTRLPEGHLEVYSSLGKAAPSYLAIVPLVHKGKTIAVLECSGYRYDPGDIENMFRIFARELMLKLSPNLT